MHTVPDTQAAIAQLIRSGAVHQALVMLNQFAMYRFTGLYAFDGSRLHNVLLHDREHPAVTRGEGAPVAETYCASVRVAPHEFELVDALVDPRVARHPKKFGVRSYFGVGVMGRGGVCVGSLCCFDVDRVVAPQSLRRLMHGTAGSFAPAVEHALAQRSVPDGVEIETVFADAD